MNTDADKPTHDELPNTRVSPEVDVDGDFEIQENDPTTLANSLEARQVIGRYRLLELIGEGGMGQVWRASQEQPVRRLVALKLIKNDVGKDAFGRFEAERQAIAMMDHPNIAQILDADKRADGSPYFVMELVDGAPLDKYCNRKKLSIKERLELMIPVCKAIQHAHQKAIIHRDLKHSNILVSEKDGQPIPKVIDFGLAKALGSQKILTDTTVYTDYGTVVGTIAYMSPEQADYSGGSYIDTRTDIYSLGVVLFKLLTGHTPIQMDGDQISVINAVRMIKEKDAVAPSECIRTMTRAQEWVAQNTPLSPEKYTDRLRGDLDTIVLKALEKSQHDRYETAKDFADDIQRYLNNETVLARPRTAFYSMRKFVQRNRGLVASLVSILVLLIAGIFGISTALLYAIKAQHETNTQLLALQLKSTDKDWRAGNTQSAWQTLKQINQKRASWLRDLLANQMSTSNPKDIIHGHAHYVLTTDISSDGTLFLSGGADNAVYLWSSQSNQLRYRKLFDDMVTCLKFSSDGSKFAVADRANLVSVFETETGKRLKTFGPFEEDVSSLAFHPLQPVLACGFFGNDSSRVGNIREERFEKTREPALIFFDIDLGESRLKVSGHQHEITSLEFSPQGDRLFSSCFDGKLRIWNCTLDGSTNTCELLNALDSHSGGIHELAISPDGTKVVCVGEDAIASLFETKNGKLLVRLSGHTKSILGVDFSPQGDLIATASNDQTAVIWDLQGNIKKVLKGHFGPLNEVRFFPDGRGIVTASDDRSLRRWSLDAPSPAFAVNDFHPSAIWQADFSPDDSMIATANQNGEISLVDAKHGVVKKRLKQSEVALSLAWLASNRLLTAGEGGKLFVWDQPDSEMQNTEPSRVIPIVDTEIWDISVSADQKLVGVAGKSGVAKLLDPVSLETVGELSGHEQGLGSVRFSSDNRFIATASDDQTVKVWDAKSLRLLKTLKGHAQPVWRAVFSPIDSEVVASSGQDGSVLIWNWRTKTVKQSLRGHATQVAGLTFSPDGKSLLTASDDGTVIVWDVESGIDLFVFEEQPFTPMIHTSFSRDGLSLITTGIGRLTVRHASPHSQTPYLRRDATELMHKYEFRVVDKNIDLPSLREIEQAATKASRYSPDYISLRTLGIARYRLGKNKEALESLRESRRLREIIYGGPGVRPITQAYLVLALLKDNQHAEAMEMKRELDLLVEFWPGDPRVKQIHEQVIEAFQ